MIAERIRERRIALGYTQRDIAKKLNISYQTVSKYEGGINTPDIEKLSMLSDILECSLDYLIGKTDNVNKHTSYTHDDIEIEISKRYPYQLTPEQVKKLVELLKSYKMDMDSIINDIKNGKLDNTL